MEVTLDVFFCIMYNLIANRYWKVKICRAGTCLFDYVRISFTNVSDISGMAIDLYTVQNS